MIYIVGAAFGFGVLVGVVLIAAVVAGRDGK